MAKTPKYLHDGTYTYGEPSAIYWIRAWREGRGRNSEIIVQVWNGSAPDGEPVGDWAMPGVLPLNAAIEQSIIQSK